MSDLLATVIAAPTTHSVAGTHVCACAEELGRAGIGFNSMVTTLPSVTKAGGQPNPNKQGRAVPRRLDRTNHSTMRPLGRAHHEHTMKRIFTLPLSHRLNGTYSQSRHLITMRS
eukprot:COSAG01_NODE_42271_length_441_cov_11.853801_1_plen_113_part_10